MRRYYSILSYLLFSLLVYDIDVIGQTNPKIMMQVPSTPNKFELQGIGVEFDPYFFSQNLPMNNGAKEADWDNVIVKRVKSMKIQQYRIGVMPQWWEPVNDNDNPAVIDNSKFTWNSIEMRSLYKVLDLAEATHASVNIVLWGCPIGATLVAEGGNKLKYIGRHFLADNGTFWVTGPKDSNEFAENFTALLKHLLVERGYTCVKAITPFNEPDGRVIDAERYAQCFRVLDQYLRKYGLRDKLSMIASDNIGQSIGYLRQCVETLPEEADYFCSHTYSFGYESKNSDIYNWEAVNQDIVSIASKPHIVGEFGSNQCVGASRQKDIDLYNRGVLLCRQAINFINAGAVSVSYWNLFDHYRSMTAMYENMQQLGLWRYVNDVYQSEPYYTPETEDYYARPQYYAYSLLCRFVRKGDLVYPINTEKDFLAGMALFHKDGTWTYIYANGDTQSYQLELKPLYKRNIRLGLYQYAEGKLPVHAKQIKKKGTLKMISGVYRVNIPGNSVMIMSQSHH